MRENSRAIVGARRCETAEQTTDPSTASRKNGLDIRQLPCKTRRSLPHPETLFYFCFTQNQVAACAVVLATTTDCASGLALSFYPL